MPVDHVRKILFIHIPKTGGTTISTLLGLRKLERSPSLQLLFGDFGAVPLEHLTVSQTEQFLTRAEFASYFRFAFVRNPWDRAVSAAFWRARFPEEGIRDLRDYLDWAERVNRMGPRRRGDEHAMPQSSFVTHGDGRAALHTIGRFETYARDAERILGRFLKVPNPLLRELHNLQRGRYRDYYHGDLERRAAALYAEDVNRFGYRF